MTMLIRDRVETAIEYAIMSTEEKRFGDLNESLAYKNQLYHIVLGTSNIPYTIYHRACYYIRMALSFFDVDQNIIGRRQIEYAINLVPDTKP